MSRLENIHEVEDVFDGLPIRCDSNEECKRLLSIIRIRLEDMQRKPYVEKEAYAIYLEKIFQLCSDIERGKYVYAYSLLRDIHEKEDIRSSGAAEIIIETLATLVGE